ncbi:DUF167 domain-containing protein [bacterium]|nr:DUF167 domain-containing protein [bacterium]
MPSCELSIRVTPRAGRDECVGEHDGAIKVKLAAAPVKGAANKALLALLSKRLGVPKCDLEIVGGETARLKRLRIEGLTEAEARRRLLGEMS